MGMTSETCESKMETAKRWLDAAGIEYSYSSEVREWFLSSDTTHTFTVRATRPWDHDVIQIFITQRTPKNTDRLRRGRKSERIDFYLNGNKKSSNLRDALFYARCAQGKRI